SVWQHCKLTVLHAKPVLIMWALYFISIQVSAQEKKLWPYAGQNQSNTHNASAETKISPSTAASLSKKWEFTTGGDVSATPAVDDQFLYFPDWAGNLYKLDAKTGV